MILREEFTGRIYRFLAAGKQEISPDFPDVPPFLSPGFRSIAPDAIVSLCPDAGDARGMRNQRPGRKKIQSVEGGPKNRTAVR